MFYGLFATLYGVKYPLRILMAKDGPADLEKRKAATDRKECDGSHS